MLACEYVLGKFSHVPLVQVPGLLQHICRVHLQTVSVFYWTDLSPLGVQCKFIRQRTMFVTVMIYVYATNHAELSIINYMAYQVCLSLLQVGTDIMECIYVH